MKILKLRLNPQAGFNQLSLDGGITRTVGGFLVGQRFLPDWVVAEVTFEGQWPDWQVVEVSSKAEWPTERPDYLITQPDNRAYPPPADPYVLPPPPPVENPFAAPSTVQHLGSKRSGKTKK